MFVITQRFEPTERVREFGSVLTEHKPPLCSGHEKSTAEHPPVKAGSKLRSHGINGALFLFVSSYLDKRK
jgi:hypothetical protein